MMYEELLQELETLASERKAAEAMSEEELQSTYKTDDSKEEILATLQGDIEVLQRQCERAFGEEAEYEYRSWCYGLDPAFSTWEEVNGLFV